MFWLGLIIGIVLTWLYMSGVVKHVVSAFSGRLWRPNLDAKSMSQEQWLLNISEHPPSSWNHLGYWKEAASYERACVELAGLLADRACLRATDRVVDVGFGCSDQLLIWVDYYQVQSLQAFSKVYWQQQQARRRCEPFSQVKIHKGDHMALAQLPESSVDKVLALDNAYYFSDKGGFFRECRRVLTDEGSLALTDMVLVRPPGGRWEQFVWETLARMAGVPLANLITREQYQRLLEAQGFEQVTVSDITDDVFSGFLYWQQQHYMSLRTFTGRQRWFKVRLTATFIRWFLVRDLVRYLLVTAR